MCYKKCSECIEDEDFLFECREDSDRKSDLAPRIAIDIPQISVITEKYLTYKFIMKIKDIGILKSLAFKVLMKRIFTYIFFWIFSKF